MKYYTYALFTPTVPSSISAHAMYPQAPLGFVFHDEENPLDVGDLRAALVPLYNLLLTKNKAEDEEWPDDWGPRAIVLRSDANTLAVSFSMSGFPTPRRIPGWSSTAGILFPLPSDEPGINAHLDGWLLSDVTTLASDVTPVSFGEIYDNCAQLIKIGGGCPCPQLEEGQCMEFTVLPQLPESFLGAMNTEYDLQSKWLESKRFRELDGFEFVKPGHTSLGDFTSADRPYDAHAFSVVEQRRAEFAARGVQRRRDNTHRKEECVRCHFVTYKRNKKGVKKVAGCDAISDCETSATSLDGWRYMESHYGDSGFDRMPTFTNEERDYLIHLGSTGVKTTAITGRTAIPAICAGFVKVNYKWVFQVSATRGRLDRFARFHNYQAFYDSLKDTPHIAAPAEIPAVEVSHKVRMACTFVGERAWVSVPCKGVVEFYRSTYRATGAGGYVERVGTNSTGRELGHVNITIGDTPIEWFDSLSWRPIRATEHVARKRELDKQRALQRRQLPVLRDDRPQ